MTCNDTRFSLPALGRVTYTEAHSAELGAIGLFAGIGWMTGFRPEVIAFTVPAFTLAVGLRAAPASMPIAGKVIRREPWYFIVSYIVTALLGALLWFLGGTAV